MMKQWYHFRNNLPPMAEADLSTKYINATGPRDADYLWDKINELHNLSAESHSEEELSYANAACAKFVNIAVENPALYDFVLDTDCDEYWDIIDPSGKVKNRSRLASEFFISWIANCVPHALALEVVYGYGIDIYGHYRKIPVTDPYFYFVFKNDLFAAIMERGITITEILREVSPNKTVFLGAGLAPEFNHLGYELSDDQSAILIDSDKTITDDILTSLPFKQRITYLHEGINIGLASPTVREADAFVASGIVSYVWNDFPTLLAAIKNLLNPGGVFIFELYPHHWEWARNKAIKGFYLPLTLFDSNNTAAKNVTEIASTQNIPAENIDQYRYYDDLGKEIMILFKITMPK